MISVKIVACSQGEVIGSVIGTSPWIYMFSHPFQNYQVFRIVARPTAPDSLRQENSCRVVLLRCIPGSAFRRQDRRFLPQRDPIASLEVAVMNAVAAITDHRSPRSAFVSGQR
jgi:hypothetical protein